MEQQEQLDPAAVLAAAGRVKSGAALAKWSPMESIPTLGVGEDIQEGQVLAGTFLRTEKIASPKFTNSNEFNDAGVPVGTRHVLENSGQKYAIWSVGELRLAFEKMTPGSYVKLTYLGKREINSRNQHTFDYAVAAPVAVAQA